MTSTLSATQIAKKKGIIPLNYREPWVCWPHAKEYAPNTVIKKLEAVGFEMVHWDVAWCYFYLEAEKREPLLHKFFTDLAASAEHRGDASFFLLRKPEASNL